MKVGVDLTARTDIAAVSLLLRVNNYLLAARNYQGETATLRVVRAE